MIILNTRNNFKLTLSSINSFKLTVIQDIHFLKLSKLTRKL